MGPAGHVQFGCALQEPNHTCLLGLAESCQQVANLGVADHEAVAVTHLRRGIGAVFGALAFRTIGDLLFVFDFEPLWQPLFQGVVLLLAVSLGALALVQVKNRLEWFR